MKKNICMECGMSELTDLMKDEPEKKPTNIIVDYKEVWRDSTR